MAHSPTPPPSAPPPQAPPPPAQQEHQAGHLLLAAATAPLAAKITQAAEGLIALRRMPFTAGLLSALGPAVALADVIVLEPGPYGPAPALRIAADLDAQHPGLSIVLVSDLGTDLTLPAMRAGVRDLLHPDASIGDIRAVLQRAVHAAERSRPLRHAITPPPPARGRVISVVSPKGGVGKTTIATNLAVGLTTFAPTSTVLVDLDLQFGDVASALDLTAERSLTDAVRATATSDSMALKTYLTQHPTGLYVLCGSEAPADADEITAEHISDLLQMLAEEFRYVVVDTAPGLSEHTLAAMDQSSDLVLVSSLDVPGIRGLRKELLTLTELNMVPDARHIVLNLADRRHGLSPADAEATLQRPIDVLLPRHKTIATSTNQGIPLLQQPANNRLTKQLRHLVNRFAPPTPPRTKGRHHTRRGHLQ